tara:strand:+ start:22262 stop:24067 length:1806 start_codon:yes stop_codon:yes gene_type:complete
MKYPTIAQMFYGVINESLDKEIYFYKEINKWKGLTGKDILSIVEKISFSLYLNGIRYQDKVAILSNTSYKWALCDYGILSMGGVTTTVYPSLMPAQIEYILNDSSSRLIFVEDQMQLEKVKSIFDSCSKLEKIVVMDNSYDGDDIYVQNLNTFLIVDRESPDLDGIDFKDMIHKSKEEDLATLIYTSGTTGTPKGVMLSNKNLLSNIYGVSRIQKDIGNEDFLSFLPLSHILERMAGHFYPMFCNSRIYYAENMETVGANMAEISPTVVVSVPRFFEKMYNAVLKGVREGSAIKQKLFWWAIKVGKDYVAINNSEYKTPYLLKLKHKLADKLVYGKIKAKIGGKIKFFISGGAPLSSDVAEFFASLNVTILEGYGLTETSPVLTSNTPGTIKFGYVGKPLENVEIKLADDGEILAKGSNIMMGYYNNKEATDEVIDSDGWFHTGDIGELDKEGYLKITDRKKSIIVTSGGKNIAPAPLENALLSSQYIEQSLVVGDKRNFLTCLIVPAFDNVKEYLSSIGKEVTSNEAIVDYPDVIELFNKELEKAMSDFSKFERIKKFALVSRQFMIEKGEMTPKMSIVRKVVEENFKDKIEALYKGANE